MLNKLLKYAKKIGQMLNRKFSAKSSCKNSTMVTLTVAYKYFQVLQQRARVGEIGREREC